MKKSLVFSFPLISMLLGCGVETQPVSETFVYDYERCRFSLRESETDGWKSAIDYDLFLWCVDEDNDLYRSENYHTHKLFEIGGYELYRLEASEGGLNISVCPSYLRGEEISEAQIRVSSFLRDVAKADYSFNLIEDSGICHS